MESDKHNKNNETPSIDTLKQSVEESDEQNKDNEVVSTKKQELEEKKLQLEILELERPWFQKPNFLVPIIGALSSILVLWVTGFFGNKIDALNTKRDQLSIETTKLEDKKKELVKDSLILEAAKTSLQIDTTFLSSKLRSITKENDSIKISLLKNSIEATKIRSDNIKLSADIIKKKQSLKVISDSLNIATRPNISIALNKIFIYEAMDIGIYLINNGTGVAYFKDINFRYEGQSFSGIGDSIIGKVIDELGLYKGYLEWDVWKLSNNIDSASSIAPNQKYTVLKITPSRAPQNFETFLKAIVGLEIEIKYQSSKGIEKTALKKFSAEDCKIY